MIGGKENDKLFNEARIREAVKKGLQNPKEMVHPYTLAYRAGWNDALEELERWLDHECALCGAVDGYDYNSGVEYGLRKAAIEAKRRKRA